MAQPICQTPALPDVRPLRVGAVSYLNSKPLIEGLSERLGRSCSEVCEREQTHTRCEHVCAVGGELRLDYPSRLADQLAAGELDVALVPSVEALRGDYQIISDACVAACGPVRSVKLYSRVPAGEIRSLALDEGSRTSAALTRVILSERYGVEPELRPFPLGSDVRECDADAILMIGDRAMNEPSEQFVETWDLGEHWYRWTGRPFVFAVWAARAGISTESVSTSLSAARDGGLRSLASIVDREAARFELPKRDVDHYLTKNLHFFLGDRERASIEFFRKLAEGAGVLN